MEKTIRRGQLAAFLFTAAAGTLLHFLFDWSGQIPLVGAVSAVNESVWEHMKLLFFPMLIAALAQRPFLGVQRRDFWCVKFIGIILGLLLIPMLYYAYTGALGIHLTWVDISIFYVAAAAAYALETRLLLPEHRRPCPFEIPAALGIALLAFVFLFLTFFPPPLPIFQDPVTLGYGIGG